MHSRQATLTHIDQMKDRKVEERNEKRILIFAMSLVDAKKYEFVMLKKTGKIAHVTNVGAS